MPDYRAMLEQLAAVMAAEPPPKRNSPKPPKPDMTQSERDAIRLARREAKYAKREAMALEFTAKYIMQKYGMTRLEVVFMHDRQHGLCANPGCNTPIPVWGKSRAIDHCHETGKVRGMLCVPCNTALGQLRENLERLQGLAIYLEKSRK